MQARTLRSQRQQLAFRCVLIIGIVNLFADMAYEGGRSIIGSFLGSLCASALSQLIALPVFFWVRRELKGAAVRELLRVSSSE